MPRIGREVRSRTYYLMGTDRRLFQNVSFPDPRYNSDHYMVLGCLCSADQQEHSRYLVQHRQSLLNPLWTQTRDD